MALSFFLGFWAFLGYFLRKIGPLEPEVILDIGINKFYAKFDHSVLRERGVGRGGVRLIFTGPRLIL